MASTQSPGTLTLTAETATVSSGSQEPSVCICSASPYSDISAVGRGESQSQPAAAENDPARRVVEDEHPENSANPPDSEKSTFLWSFTASWTGKCIGTLGLILTFLGIVLALYLGVMQMLSMRWQNTNDALQSCLSAHDIGPDSKLCAKLIQMGVTKPPMLHIPFGPDEPPVTASPTSPKIPHIVNTSLLRPISHCPIFAGHFVQTMQTCRSGDEPRTQVESLGAYP